MGIISRTLRIFAPVNPVVDQRKLNKHLTSMRRPWIIALSLSLSAFGLLAGSPEYPFPSHLETTPVAPEYHQTTAQPGDGIYSMLRRYKLDSHRCNFDKFYALNQLPKNSRLRAGKTYFLPIQVYQFDGRTIRSTIGNDDWDTAVTIRDYNHLMTELGLLSGPYEETRILWVPHHITNCENDQIDIPSPVQTDPEQQMEAPASTSSAANVSASSGRRVFPIFGPDHAYTPLASTQLRGKVFYIVSGHGGPDPGAIGNRGNYILCEDEYAYDVALRLCRNLIAHGATAYMINRDADDGIRDDKFLECDTDEVIWGGARQSPRQKVRLMQRSNMVNELYEKHRLQGVTDQRMIVIHVDSRSRRERVDLFFYHYPGSDEGRGLAQQMHRTMRQKYRRYRANGDYHGSVSGRDLHMLRECLPTSVYVELANIGNIHDQQRIILQRNRQLLADWMLEGILSD